MFEENIDANVEETEVNSTEAEQSIEEVTNKPVKKIKPKKLNKKKDNKFPREDRNEDVTREGVNPRQFSDAWTTCSRCRDQILSFGEATHYIDGYQYCTECFEFVKDDYLVQDTE